MRKQAGMPETTTTKPNRKCFYKRSRMLSSD